MRFRCYRCPDRRPGFYGLFAEFEGDRGAACPSCGQRGGLVPLVDVHYLAAHPDGPIWDAGGGRWRVLCSPRRDFLAADQGDTYSATHHAGAVTCRSCMGHPEWQAAARAMAEFDGALRMRLEDAARGGGGCCG